MSETPRQLIHQYRPGNASKLPRHAVRSTQPWAGISLRRCCRCSHGHFPCAASAHWLPRMLLSGGSVPPHQRGAYVCVRLLHFNLTVCDVTSSRVGGVFCPFLRTILKDHQGTCEQKWFCVSFAMSTSAGTTPVSLRTSRCRAVLPPGDSWWTVPALKPLPRFFFSFPCSF